MTLFQAYLSTSRVQKVISKRPGETGFSLIELVVVVAVLAILAAIAIPAFTTINDEARVSGAKTTLANLAKECAVKLVGTGSLAYNMPTLSGYTITTSGTTEECGNDEIYTATPPDSLSLPTFTLDTTDGSKTCSPNGNGTNRGLGCNGFQDEETRAGQITQEAAPGTW